MRKLKTVIQSAQFNFIDWLLLLGLLLVPFSTGIDSRVKVVISYSWPVFFLACCLIVFSFILRKNSVKKINIPFLLLGGLLALSTLGASVVSAWHFPSLFRSFNYFMGFLIFIYLLSSTSLLGKNSEINFRIIIVTLALSGTLLACYYIFHLIDMVSIHGLKIILYSRTNQGIAKLPWGATNTIAGILNPFIFLTLYLGLTSNQIKKKMFWYAFSGLIIITILLTLSRGGFISLLAGILLLLILFRRYYILAVLTLILIICTNIILLLQNQLPLLRNFFLRRIEAFSNGRSDIWNSNFSWIHEHYTSMIGYYMSLYTFGHSSHNIFLTTFIERGALGFLLILIFAAIYLYWILNNIGVSSKAVCVFYKFVLAGTLTSWIHLQFEDFNFTQQYFFYNWCILGLIFLAKPILSGQKTPSIESNFSKKEKLNDKYARIMNLSKGK